ncbi:SH3 domain-containing protein [Desulfoferrobacter suflitae]|uniref:SH3 domain-containing protein n=1 Tax=Desulfoferrobacter suflitae TaxID=2865782 RepID=UPI002164A0A4|nr:SH3 domain-containing protein [Desulfoferrobacter suflitae]MCK8603825.1 SH3 domain-containing protein [Desulfoferrobacter suflitae]
MIRRLVSGLVVVLFSATLAQAKMVSVARDKVNMRSGPGLNYAVLWELGEGYPLEVIERKNGWLKVKDFEDDTGWIYAKLVSDKAYLVVMKERINLRSGPGVTYSVVGKVQRGEVLRRIKQDKDWFQVKHENGLAGWVRKDLVWGW